MGWPCTRPTRTSPGSASWPGRTRSTDRSGWRGCVRPERLAAMGGRLDELDLGLGLSREEEAKRLSRAQLRLVYLRLVLGGLMGDEPRIGPPVCIVFEGWDASGKGGCIKRLVAPMDPRHVRVAQFAAPTYDEKRHHFLWRRCPAGAEWPCSTGPGTAGCWWSGWRGSPPRSSGGGRTTRSASSSAPWSPRA